jgi:serine/threonine kinase 38
MASEEFEEILHKYKEKKRPLSELYADPPVDQLRKKMKISAAPKPKISLSDFHLIKKIGKGSFGEVHLCRKKDTGELLALKMMKKSLIWKKNKVRNIKNERDVLAKHLTSYLVQLMYSFQDNEKLYLAMEYCPGGDLRRLLDDLQTLTEDEAKVYLADMIMAVNSLHQLEYIHRDLKPDNFLIDAQGRLKLTDFGLSKEGVSSKHHVLASPMPKKQFGLRGQRTPFNACQNLTKRQKAFSVVGSPDYMSPEVLTYDNNARSYGREVDWWSIGCIFFEMLTGFAPFSAETPEAVFDNIKNWKEYVPYMLETYIRPNFSDETTDLIQQFLTSPDKRLGSNGVQSIKTHPFFRDLDWDNLKQVKPLFVPKLNDELDTTYFIDEAENATAEKQKRRSTSRHNRSFDKEKGKSSFASSGCHDEDKENQSENGQYDEESSTSENEEETDADPHYLDILTTPIRGQKAAMQERHTILGFTFKRPQIFKSIQRDLRPSSKLNFDAIDE